LDVILNSATTQTTLEQAFEFKSSDLSANRDLQLTTTQHEKLKEKTTGFWRNTIVVIIVMGLIALVAFLGFGVFGDDAGLIFMGRLLVTLVITLLTLATLAAMRYTYSLARKDYNEKSVVIEQGQLEIIEPSSGKLGKLKVNETIFTVTLEQYETMKQLHEEHDPVTVAIYHSQRSKHIFSVEVLSQ